MRKLLPLVLAAALLVGCSSPAPLDTGVVQYKHYWPEKLVKKSTCAKVCRRHTYLREEQWCLYVLADAWLDERRPHPSQRTETSDRNLQSKHTHTVCLPEGVWDGYLAGDVYTW